MKCDVSVECPVKRCFRVDQVAGLFDLTAGEVSRQDFSVEVPDPEEAWQVGCIVGPSGSGKSTIARELYGSDVVGSARWPKGQAVIEAIGGESIQEATAMLTAVGFSSPPAWLRPYAVLSNGEKFRCDLARALLGKRKRVVYDEFTSVVDRTVAQIGSAAVAKAIRRTEKRFVAVTCHYDIIEWLTPDWVLDMATCQLARGCLQRPPVRLEISRCKVDRWAMFKRHHYLSASLPMCSVCYLAHWKEIPVAFVAVASSLGHKGVRRIARVVVLPDYQGIGIGSAVTGAVADLVTGQGLRCGMTTSHPAMIGWLARSPLWRARRVMRHGSAKVSKNTAGPRLGSRGRPVVGFEYVGE